MDFQYLKRVWMAHNISAQHNNVEQTSVQKYL